MSETHHHILVIDDDQSILEMMHVVLEEEGNYQVTTRELVFEDLTDVECLQPDLIILDFVMQGRQTTWTFLQKLKLYHQTKDIPIMLCTAGLADVKEQEPILAQKGIPILYKPFDVDELLHIVKEMISRVQKG